MWTCQFETHCLRHWVSIHTPSIIQRWQKLLSIDIPKIYRWRQRLSINDSPKMWMTAMTINRCLTESVNDGTGYRYHIAEPNTQRNTMSIMTSDRDLLKLQPAIGRRSQNLLESFGNQLFRLRVRVRQFSSKKFQGWGWDVVIPSTLIVNLQCCRLASRKEGMTTPTLSLRTFYPKILSLWLWGEKAVFRNSLLKPSS